jgi:hypothetical protein
VSPSRAERPAPAVRVCARCGKTLTGQNINGWYYVRPTTAEAAATGRFSEQVFDCDGEPHDVRYQEPTGTAPEPGVTDD